MVIIRHSLAHSVVRYLIDGLQTLSIYYRAVPRPPPYRTLPLFLPLVHWMVYGVFCHFIRTVTPVRFQPLRPCIRQISFPHSIPPLALYALYRSHHRFHPLLFFSHAPPTLRAPPSFFRCLQKFKRSCPRSPGFLDVYHTYHESRMIHGLENPTAGMENPKSV